MSKHLVLSAKPYDFENKRGDRVKGIKVSYLNSKPSTRENEIGHAPMIVNIGDLSLMSKLDGNVPGVFDLEFEQITGQGNKPELMLVGLEAIAPVDLTSLF